MHDSLYSRGLRILAFPCNQVSAAAAPPRPFFAAAPPRPFSAAAPPRLF